MAEIMPHVSATSLDKNITSQGRVMGIRNISKEYEDMFKYNKTEAIE